MMSEESPEIDGLPADEAATKIEAPTDSTEPERVEPTICLDQFLKTCGVETGGQAKQMIQAGEVLLNGEIETRRRKKLRHGDEVRLFDDVFVVEFESGEEE